MVKMIKYIMINSLNRTSFRNYSQILAQKTKENIIWERQSWSNSMGIFPLVSCFLGNHKRTTSLMCDVTTLHISVVVSLYRIYCYVLCLPYCYRIPQHRLFVLHVAYICACPSGSNTLLCLDVLQCMSYHTVPAYRKGINIT